ncbi:MAG: class I tRNA ligase family protein, partial [Candidatus Acidiferrales bacterium]
RWFQCEGADAWYKYAASDLLPQGTRCASCNGAGFRKETDILDVWFDSGSSHLAVLGHRKDVPWPADLYFEGLDQYRGWFHSSLLVALGVKEAAPYRAVLTHAWVLDAEGRPMSKSLGNYVAASELIEKHGAEIFRLLAASVDYRGDVRMGPALFEQSAEAYRKIRNTFRYCLSNLNGFDPARDAVPNEKLEELDRWMLGRTAELAARCRAAYDRYEFFKVYHALYSFCTVDLSAVYFDILKDRLYTSHPSSPARRSAQTAIHRICDALVRIAAPFLVFTTEEVWRHLPGPPRAGAASVHLAEFPQPKDIDAGLAADKTARWEKLFEVRGEVLKALERARQAKQIRGSLDAQVTLRAEGDWAALLNDYKGQLRALFIVSAVQLSRDSVPEIQPSDLPGLAIGVRAA